MTWARPSETERQERSASRKASNMAVLARTRGREGVTMGGGITTAVPKVVPVEHEGYRRLVAAMPCKHCGIVGYSQAAHPNTNKGAGTKTDDRLCFPLCTVHPVAGGYVQGCHERFDQDALYTKAVRREIEPAWGADTRASIIAAGNWPKNLPKWTDQ